MAARASRSRTTRPRGSGRCRRTAPRRLRTSGERLARVRFEKETGASCSALEHGYGTLDQIIPPHGHYRYMQRLFDRTGGVSATQEFYRYYVFPDATHCGGAGMTNPVLFEALVNWVEHGIAPDHVVAQVNPTRTRKVCMYPDVARYSGSGSTDDEASFTCEHRDQDDPALLAQDRGMLEGLPPLKGNDDIRNVPGGGRDDADE